MYIACVFFVILQFLEKFGDDQILSELSNQSTTAFSLMKGPNELLYSSCSMVLKYILIVVHVALVSYVKCHGTLNISHKLFK